MYEESKRLNPIQDIEKRGTMPVVVYSTIDTMKNAKKIAHALVGEKLVACVNIIPKVESVYRWKGNIEEAQEIILIAKTTDPKVKETIEKIRELHPYEVPAITVLPLIGGLKEFLDYLADETT